MSKRRKKLAEEDAPQGSPTTKDHVDPPRKRPALLLVAVTLLLLWLVFLSWLALDSMQS